MPKKPHYLLNDETGRNDRAIAQLKKDVMSHYGGKCSVCGNDDLDVLTFDHMERNGFIGTLYFCRAHNYPEGRLILCANCKHKRQYS